MKKLIIAAVMVGVAGSAGAVDFNDNRKAIEDIKENWIIYYIDNNGKYQISVFDINEIRYFFDAGFAGKGFNSFELLFYGGTGSEITCFYINKPSAYERNYGCVDMKSSSLNYYSFNLNGKTIEGTIGIQNDATTHRPVNYYAYFSGNVIGEKLPVKYGEYKSDYNLIQWDKHQDDRWYCVDIVDENGNIYPGFQAIKCGDNIANFSPKDYVTNVMHTTLPSGFTFYWKVWSKTGDVSHYNGVGYEGKVVVP